MQIGARVRDVVEHREAQADEVLRRVLPVREVVPVEVVARLARLDLQALRLQEAGEVLLVELLGDRARVDLVAGRRRDLDQVEADRRIGLVLRRQQVRAGVGQIAGIVDAGVQTAARGQAEAEHAEGASLERTPEREGGVAHGSSRESGAGDPRWAGAAGAIIVREGPLGQTPSHDHLATAANLT
ncbi:MAG: hypothetical protein QM820_62745 [Minicystis sp.]